MNNMLNTIAILCILPLVIITLVFTKLKENSSTGQKLTFYIIYRLLPLTSLFIWSNMLLNSCAK